VSDVVAYLRAELPKYRDRKFRLNAQQFFKEKLENPWMLRGPVFYRISGDAYKRHLKDRPKKEVLDACEAVLASDLEARRGFAFDWAWRQRKHLAPRDFARFERWLKKHVENWGHCDSICTRALGHLLLDYPELIPRTKKWAASRNMWVRRAAAVCLIPSLNQGKALEDAFEIADVLLMDPEDLVQKGYGWMLKQAANTYRKEVFRYVVKHRAVMPRTALRYAIEKMPQAMRKEAMKKEN